MGTNGALHGIRVLDLGQFLSAPRCGQILAEAGADVIKIEPPMGETMRLLLALAAAEPILSTVNAGKRGVVLDLKADAGRELFQRLVQVSDVVLENFSFGVMEKMGLGYEALAALNPRLIYASISGFGKDGLLKDRGAFDIIAQATSGIMAALDMPDRPPPVFFADLVSGGYAAMAIAFALFARERSGIGRRIDISMQDVMYAHHFPAHSLRAMGERGEQTAALLGRPISDLMADPENPLPFWNSYRARDGHVAVVALTDGQWRRLMSAIGRSELASDPRFDNFVVRVHNAAAGVEILAGWVAERSVDEVVARLSEHRVPCGRVCSVEEANADPQLTARGMLHQVEHPALGTIAVPGTALKMSTTPGQVASAHPALGQHTEEVLQQLLDLSAPELARWRARGAF